MKKNILFFINLLLPFLMFSQTLSSISPASANAGQTLSITITGSNTHFVANGTNVVFYFAQKSGSTTTVANSIAVLNNTTLTANITIPSDVYTGNYVFSVADSMDGQFPLYGQPFYVNGVSLPLDILVGQVPVLAGETVDITITGIRGTHFNSPASKTTVNFVGNRTIIINSESVVNDSVIELNITAPDIAGGYDVFVNDSIDGQIKGGFKVYPNCFSHFKTTYDASTNVFTLALDSATSLAASFHWEFGDGTISTDSFPSHTFTEDKLYVVCLKISNAAGDSCKYCHEMGKDSLGNPIFKTKGFSIQVTPYKKVINEIPLLDNNQHFISVYPNPAANRITISSTTPISSLNKPVLSIYNIEGKLLLQQAFVKETMNLDISVLTKGIYIMQLTGSKQTEIIKFAKE